MDGPVVLTGRYLVPSGGEYDCRALCHGPDRIEILGDRMPELGAEIVCRVAKLGTLRGVVADVRGDRFEFVPSLGLLGTRRLAGRIRWHRDRQAGRVDQRDAARVVPVATEVSVTWDGTTVPGALRDISASGASIDVAPRPDIGTAVTIGRRRATVVRHTEHGVGAKFVLPLRPEDVTEQVVL